MAFDEALGERLKYLTQDDPDVTHKKMFGGLAMLLKGKMFCGVIGDQIMARIGKANWETALARPHVAEMDFTGRSMKGYVYVAPDGIADDEMLGEWVEMAKTFVRTEVLGE